MNRETERELAVVISEEKAKVVLGDGYGRLAYPDWVEELKSFVQTQLCADCGSPYDLDEPEEQMWGWYVDGEDGEGSEMEELEVVEFFCVACTDETEEELEANHPRTWGSLVFRRKPTGTFPLDEDDEIILEDSSDDDDEDDDEDWDDDEDFRDDDR